LGGSKKGYQLAPQAKNYTEQESGQLSAGWKDSVYLDMTLSSTIQTAQPAALEMRLAFCMFAGTQKEVS